MRKAWNPPFLRPILIYFEFRSKPSLITVICMDPRPTNYLRENIFFSYPEMIRVSFSLFLSFSFSCYITLLLIFTKNILLLLLLLLLLLFSWKLFLFFHFPGCSGMFRVTGFMTLSSNEMKKKKKKIQLYNEWMWSMTALSKKFNFLPTIIFLYSQALEGFVCGI